jgi:hypothetical protein
MKGAAVAVPARFFSYIVAVVAVLGGVFIPPRIAAATPPGFPDVNAFAPVDPRPHIYDALSGDPHNLQDIRVRFATPYGVACLWSYATSETVYSNMECIGNIPGIPDSVPDNGGLGCARVGQLNGWSNEIAFDRHWGSCPPFPPIASLDVGQKIDAGNTTCVVGDNSLIACIDPAHDRGFVLQPSGSWVF